MTSKVFFDTNILVYSVDTFDTGRQDAARSFLRDAAANGNGVLSTQVLQEFYVTVTKKLGVHPMDARSLLVPLQQMEVITVTPALIHKAVDLSVLNRISFWDALILSAAASAGCSTLYTEDLNHGQVIDNIAVCNPFRP